MEDVARLQSLGISMTESRSGADYGRAKTGDELHFAAGEHLALHAAAVTAALRLPRRGSLVLALMERTGLSSWERYWRINNDALSPRHCSIYTRFGRYFARKAGGQNSPAYSIRS